MKKEHIMDAMDYIDPALIAAADTPARRRSGKGRLRYGLIAACLSLALMGTAAAAQHFGVRIVEGNGVDADIWMEGGISYYPVDSLSEEVLALDDPYYAVKAFDSWDELEEFIGVDLMNNPVLDAAPVKVFGWKDRVNHVRGRFLAGGSGNLSIIHIVCCYEIGAVDIRVHGFLITDRQDAENWDERFLGYFVRDGAQVNQESYTTPNGLETQLITMERDARYRYPDQCIAVFSLNGVPFVLSASPEHKNLAAVQEAMLQVLDGFVLD